MFYGDRLEIPKIISQQLEANITYVGYDGKTKNYNPRHYFDGTIGTHGDIALENWIVLIHSKSIFYSTTSIHADLYVLAIMSAILPQKRSLFEFLLVFEPPVRFSFVFVNNNY